MPHFAQWKNAKGEFLWHFVQTYKRYTSNAAPGTKRNLGFQNCIKWHLSIWARKRRVCRAQLQEKMFYSFQIDVLHSEIHLLENIA